MDSQEMTVSHSSIDRILEETEVREIVIEKPGDIPVLEAGYEILASRGDIYADMLRHEEDQPTVVRGYGEKMEELPEQFGQIRRRGSGGTVYHGDTDCLTVAAPIEFYEFDQEKAWDEFIGEVNQIVEELGESDTYRNGRDLLLNGSLKKPEDDPQVAGTSLRTGPGYTVMRACLKGREEDTLTEQFQELLEADGIDPEEYREKNYFVEDETGQRFRDRLLGEDFETYTVEEFLRKREVYDEAREKARETQHIGGVRTPESCVLGYREPVEQTS